MRRAIFRCSLKLMGHLADTRAAVDWILTRLPESSPGLHSITLDPQYIGSPKDELRIALALQHVHDSCLLGNNPTQCPRDVLQNGIKLFTHLFPNPDEREDPASILDRLGNREMRRGTRGCFDVIINRDAHGRVISWHQFSTIPLADDDGAVAFMQYTGSADEAFMNATYNGGDGHHGHGIYTLNTALMQQVADENARLFLERSGGVKGYFLETEFKGQGNTDDDIRFTAKRLKIHEMTGAKAIMLRMKDGSLLSPHYQPALGQDSEPIKLLLLFRRTSYDATTLHQIEDIAKDEAERLLLAFIDNFDTEGFDSCEVNHARSLIKSWFEMAESAVLVPPTLVPDIVTMAQHDSILRDYVHRTFGPLDEHGKRVQTLCS